MLRAVSVMIKYRFSSCDYGNILLWNTTFLTNYLLYPSNIDLILLSNNPHKASEAFGKFFVLVEPCSFITTIKRQSFITQPTMLFMVEY